MAGEQAVRGRWHFNVFILQNAVVGGICEAAPETWEAFGCQRNWYDTILDTFLTKAGAMRAVEEWANEHAT
jgi:hypothetical protein